TEEDSSTVFYINLAWAFLIYIILYILAPYIAQFYKLPELTSIARILFLVIFINSLMVVFRAQLTINLDFRSQTVAATYGSVLSGILAVYCAHQGYDYWSIVIMLLSKSIIVLLGLFYYSHWIPKLCFSKNSFLSLFKFGSYLMLASMLATVVNNLSTVLVGRFFNATNVGFFTQATNISNYASQVITSTLQSVTYPVMASIKDERERLLLVYQHLVAITMCISLPLLVGLAAVSKEVVILFLGNEWSAVITVLIALCFARAITPISAINMNILNVIGRSDLFFKVDLCKIPISLLAIFIAIPFGISALAWSSIVTSLLAFFINAYYPGKLFGFGVMQQLKVAKNYILSSGIMYAILFAISIENIFISLCIKIVVGIIVYSSFLLIMKDAVFIDYVSKISTFMRGIKHKNEL
ncbi:lipopolysaccharide biosynthesis protein, partial [Wohlfahrtiimonas larvae]